MSRVAPHGEFHYPARDESDIGLLCQGKGVIDLNPEVANGAFKLRVAQE